MFISLSSSSKRGRPILTPDFKCVECRHRFVLNPSSPVLTPSFHDVNLSIRAAECGRGVNILVDSLQPPLAAKEAVE
jgi:hypothetical protein